MFVSYTYWLLNLTIHMDVQMQYNYYLYVLFRIL